MKKYIIYTIMSLACATIGGLIYDGLFEHHDAPYGQSKVTIVSQEFVPEKYSYETIVGINTRKHGDNTDIGVMLSDGETSWTTVKTDAWDNQVDLKTITKLFGNIQASKYNRDTKVFSKGTRVQTRYYPSHYIIKYKSNWNNNRVITFNSTKPVNTRTLNMAKFNDFMVANHYFPEYYTN